MLTIHSVTPHYYTGAKVLIQDGNNRLSVNSEGHFVPYTYNCFYLAYFLFLKVLVIGSYGVVKLAI